MRGGKSARENAPRLRFETLKREGGKSGVFNFCHILLYLTSVI